MIMSNKKVNYLIFKYLIIKKDKIFLKIKMEKYHFLMMNYFNKSLKID